MNPLQSLLHDTLALGLKAQNFHWNVEGPHFGPLHDLFGSEYESLFKAADTIAERLRAQGEIAHAHNSNDDTKAVGPIPSTPPKALEMIQILALEHQKLGIFCNKMSQSTSKDAATSNLFAERQHAHEKSAWMLRSHLIKS